MGETTAINWTDKTCRQCGTSLTPENTVEKGRRLCKSCKNKRARAAYMPRARQSKLGSLYAETRDGDVKQARARVNHRIDVGLLADPNTLPCMDCGHVWTPGERRHEYDHARGYGAAHQLDVEPVCTTCHATREAKRGKRGRHHGADGRFTEAA